MSNIHPGSSLFRNALLLESLGNISGGLGFLFFPKQVLSLMVKSPTTQVTASSIDLIRWFGALTLALTTPLILAYPNTTSGVVSRYTAYMTLGAGEAFIVPVMLWQLSSGQSAFSDRFLLGAITTLGGIVAWRGYCLLLNRELVGYVRDEKKAS